ncbi:MAG TPA: hypothetical protein PKW21_13115 [Rhabdaerophilum sp.]|nr:hypothetical protein [Rhabdaerophilum sp.]
MRLIYIAAVLALAATHRADAGIWSEPTGDARKFVKYRCDPCCEVTSLHGTRRIHAKLFIPLYPREVEIAPYQTETFNAPRECMKAGFGLEVNFVD